MRMGAGKAREACKYKICRSERSGRARVEVIKPCEYLPRNAAHDRQRDASVVEVLDEG